MRLSDDQIANLARYFQSVLAAGRMCQFLSEDEELNYCRDAATSPEFLEIIEPIK